MPITDTEAADAFRFLAAALREKGLGWVVAQVEEKLALGKVQAKKLSSREVPEPGETVWEIRESRAPTQQKSAFFAVSEQYTAQERLNVLLDSITLAVPIVHQVANQTFENLEDLGIKDRLDFAPEAEVSDSFSLMTDDLRSRAGSNQRLIALVEELRGGETIANQTESTR